MAWQNPKTNWGAADGVRDTDFNRIEGNILELYNGTALHEAVTIYVSNSGNDNTGNGTQASPYATIAKALSMLPRDLNGNRAVIFISAGTYNEHITIADYNGTVTLSGMSGTIVYIGGITVKSSDVQVGNISLRMSATQTGILITDGATFINTGNMQVNGGTTSVLVTNGSLAVFGGNLNVNNSTSAMIEVTRSSRAYIGSLDGTSNLLGIRVTMGGMVSYGTNTASAGTAYAVSGGSRLYSGAQASIPNY